MYDEVVVAVNHANGIIERDCMVVSAKQHLVGHVVSNILSFKATISIDIEEERWLLSCWYRS
jgi:hypothetical protein